MNWLSRFFLRAKHWQMFLLLFGFCTVGQFVGEVAVTVTAPTPGELGWTALVELWLLTVASDLVFLSWLWFMGSFLCFAVRPELRPRLAFFRVATVYLLVCIFVGSAPIAPHKTVTVGVLFPLWLFTIICVVYMFNFVAKALALAETGKPKVLHDFAGTILLLVFFPVGVWFTQPRVNRLYNSRPTPRIGRAGKAGTPKTPD